MPNPQNKAIPNSLRFYRRRQNLKLYELADRIGLSSASHLAHWEMGRKIPTLQNVLKLSIVLNVQVSSLYFELYRQLRDELSNQKLRASRPRR